MKNFDTHRHRTSWLATLALLLLSTAPLVSQDAPSEESMAFFKSNCASCHTIGGGRLAGPDLKGVDGRKDRDWLINFVADPKSVIDSGDAYARKLVEEARGALMPNVPGMSKALAAKLVDLIKAESALEKSHFMGVVLSDRPLTAEDVARGKDLFTGVTPFKAGAPACNSCHTVRDLEGFGGGRLGPDLTSAFARLEGRKALGAWLAAPPSIVMQPVFKEHALESDEILSMVAFLKSEAEGGDAPLNAGPSLEFVLAGLGAAAFLIVCMDFAWRRRYRAVRRPLVNKDSNS
jgi:mono/diheme cytochrome c family protein